MNRAAIRAELRRSANDGLDPWTGIDADAFAAAMELAAFGDMVAYATSTTLKTYWLLVAEALEG